LLDPLQDFRAVLCFALRAFNAVDLIVLLAEFSRESQT
jgi:hypothetical protein